jgi:hypothetical protein
LLGVGQLPEVWLHQAAVPFEDVPLRAADRPGGDGGEFVLAIGFVEGSKWDVQPAQSIQANEKLPFIGDADDDKMWMGQILRNE